MKPTQPTQMDVEATIRTYASRPISASLPRMATAGALTLIGFVVVVFGNRDGWLSGGFMTLLVLFALLGLINVVATRADDALEARRWQRFRSGGILGLILGAALGFAGLQDSGTPPLALSLVLSFLVLVPAAAGFTLGYLNLRLRDQGDKSKLAAKLRAGAQATASKPDKGQTAPASEQLSEPQTAAQRPPGTTGRKGHGSDGTRAGDDTVGFYWFDSRVISEIATGNYGRFVYDRILPLLAPAHQKGPKPWCIFFDGDCMTSADTLRWYFRPEDGALLERAREIDETLCYVVGVLGAGIPTPTALDQALRLEQVPGYLGLTMPAPSNRGRAALEKCRLQMALSIAGRIDGTTFKAISYGFHAGEELKAMGFRSIA